MTYLHNPPQLSSRLFDSRAITAIQHEDERVCAGEVMSPQWPDLVLPTHVPDIEARVFVGDCFDVEADCRYCVDLCRSVVSGCSCGNAHDLCCVLGAMDMLNAL